MAEEERGPHPTAPADPSGPPAAEWDVYQTDEPAPPEIWTPMYGATAEQLAEACRPREDDSPGLRALKQRSHDYERLLVDVQAKANERLKDRLQELAYRSRHSPAVDLLEDLRAALGEILALPGRPVVTTVRARLEALCEEITETLAAPPLTPGDLDPHRYDHGW